MRRIPKWNNGLCLATILGVLSVVLITHTLIGATSNAGAQEDLQKPRLTKPSLTKPSRKDHQATEMRPAKNFVLKKELAVRAGGTLFVEADRGSIEVMTADVRDVAVEVIRSIPEKYSVDAEAILNQHEVVVSRVANDVVVKSRVVPLTANVDIGDIGFDVSDDIQETLKAAIHKRLQRIYLRITTPTEFNVKLKTSGQGIQCGDLIGQADCVSSGGSIKLGRISGKVDASTSGGSLALQSAGSCAQLKTSGGSIRAGDVNGDATIRTSGGSISLGRVLGRVSATTSGGSIHIVDADGAVEAITSGGSISATISAQPKSDSYFSTTGGSIRIAIAKELAFDVEHLGKGRASGPFLTTKSIDGVHARLNGGGPKLVTKGNVRFAYLNDNSRNH